MTDEPTRADLQRLKRRRWSADDTADGTAGDTAARRRAECAATRAGHLDVVLVPDGAPRCDHCDETLSPDALRRAGIRAQRP